MKFYVASSLKNRDQVRAVAAELKNSGWHHTYDWTQNERANSLDELAQIGKHEKQAVADSDVILVLLPGGNGTHIELGLAIAWGKRTFLYSPDEKVMNLGTTSTFYHLPEVEICIGSIEDLIEKVKVSIDDQEK